MGTSFSFAASSRTGGIGAGSPGIRISPLAAGPRVFADWIDHSDLYHVYMAGHLCLAGAAALFAGTGICVGDGRKGAAAGERFADALGVGGGSWRLEREVGRRVDPRIYCV